MPESAKIEAEIESNVVSNQDSVEEISRLKIQDNQEQGDMAQLKTYPDRPGKPDCAYFLRTGSCGYGSKCRYNHPPYAAQVTQFRVELPERVGQPDCGFYIRTGTCKYGSTCKYNHPRDRDGAGPVSLNSLGLPMRQDEKPCPYYMRTGDCKFSVACKFHHPEPVSRGTHSPQLRATVFGSTGSSIIPPISLTYVGGLPTFSRTMYMPNPYPQGPQAHMPVVFCPSQGLGPAQGWNTYMGCNLFYDTRSKGESGYDEQMLLSSTTSPFTSQRTNQLEHQYIVNNGKETNKCKANGKYQPKERKEHPVSETVGPHGLLSRPEQAQCPYYNMYGLCKFGPGCRFDHSFPGYPNILPLYVLNPSSVTYPRIWPAAVSSSTPLSSSPKHADFVVGSDGADNKHQNVDANRKTIDDSTEQTGSLQLQSSQASPKPST